MRVAAIVLAGGRAERIGGSINKVLLPIDLVAIHDGARPFMTLGLLEACVGAADRFGGAVPGLPPEGPLYHTGWWGG